MLAAAFGDLSRTRLRQLIEQGKVSAGARLLSDPAHRVKPGTALTLDIPAPESIELRGQAIPLTVVYEDAHLIVIDKPKGLVVHPAAGNRDGTLVNALIAHCGESLRGIGGELRPGIVHRIDKDTTGLIVAAKTEQAHRSLSKQFAAHAIERAYLAVVWGAPRPREGLIEGNLARSPLNRQKMAVVPTGGKEARTRYKVIKTFGAPATPTAALVECRLETGRTHQVRVHMTHLGYPLIGDPVYGRPRSIPGLSVTIGRQALHAAVLGFQHPATHKPLKFNSEPPADFTQLCLDLDTLKGNFRGA